MNSDRRDFDFVANNPGIQSSIIPPVDILGLQRGANYPLLPRQGFRPEGEIPRSLSSNSRVY